MKKLLYLLLAITLTSCGGDNDENSLSNGTYSFEIELCGLTHSIQGNNEDMFLNGQNSCSAFLSSGIQALGVNLTDITAPDYVSGQPINITVGILNPQLGADNTGILSFQSSASSDFLNNIADCVQKEITRRGFKFCFDNTIDIFYKNIIIEIISIFIKPVIYSLFTYI